MAPAIEIRGLSKRYRLGSAGPATLREALSRRGARESGEVWSLRDIDLDVAVGESVAVIGRNGAGKTTLLRILARITEPTAGVCRTRGRVGALLEVGAGFHPELTGRENVYLNGAILGLTRPAIAARFDEIVAFADVERFLDTPVKRYSSGMYLRLAFAVAAHLEPAILAVDEVLAVGDAEFQRRCLGKMAQAGSDGRTVLFVSHDLEAAARLCARAVWLDRGEIRLDGPTAEVVRAYLGAASGNGPVERRFAAAPDAVAALVSARVGDAPLDRVDPLSIELEFTLAEPVRGLNAAAFLTSDAGVRVIDEAWRRGHDADDVASAGRYRARVELPPVLNVGTYTLGVWIGTAYDDLVEIDDALTFQLGGDGGHRADRLLNLDARWQVDAV